VTQPIAHGAELSHALKWEDRVPMRLALPHRSFAAARCTPRFAALMQFAVADHALLPATLYIEVSDSSLARYRT